MKYPEGVVKERECRIAAWLKKAIAEGLSYYGCD